MFKNYGSVFTSLHSELKIASIKVYNRHYGTSRYFEYHALYLHRAFELWAKSYFPQDQLQKLFYDLKKQYQNNIVPQSTSLSVLFNSLPDQFNVRGRWTPTYYSKGSV